MFKLHINNISDVLNAVDVNDFATKLLLCTSKDTYEASLPYISFQHVRISYIMRTEYHSFILTVWNEACRWHCSHTSRLGLLEWPGKSL